MAKFSKMRQNITPFVVFKLDLRSSSWLWEAVNLRSVSFEENLNTSFTNKLYGFTPKHTPRKIVKLTYSVFTLLPYTLSLHNILL